MAIALPDLPYAADALEPYISATTLSFHYGKHHRAYVDNLNKMIDGGAYASASLEEIIKDTADDASKTGIFNNSAQVWNHTFYWRSMSPDGGGDPTGPAADAINAAFGGYDGFKHAFAQAGVTQFGAGWAWLVAANGALEVRKTSNAQTPLTDPDATPLLTMDVWEHAYYLDFQNKRPAYVEVFMAHLINWDFVNENLKTV
ncbi:MAG: superoxide dismutase [Pseudomonadota bacterium]